MTDLALVRAMVQKFGTTPDPEVITAAVDAYLEEHPLAIDDTAGAGDTDKVLSADKVTEITSGLSSAIAKVTPEQFGAKGDGTTDDTEAIQAAVDAGYEVRFGDNKTYYLASTVTIDHDCHLIGGENTVIKTETQDGSLKHVFIVTGTLKKTTTLTTDYTSGGNTANSGNMFTLADMDGIKAGDIIIVKATDQYYSYARQYYYLGMTLLVGDKDNNHIYTTESMPWDMSLTENVSVRVYSAPTAIIENLSFVADRESIGNYAYLVSLISCKNSVIKNCKFAEMDNGILVNHCVNTKIDSVAMSDGKNDNTIQGDGYGIVIEASTNTIIEGINAICAQTPITTGGDVVVVNLFVRNCDLTSQCRHHGIGMHENSYNIVVEDCTLGGLNVLGTGTVNRCRFINNRRLGSQDGGITFCGSHNPKFATLRVNGCKFEGGTRIYIYSPGTQEPVQAFDCIVGLVDIRDCEGGSLCTDGTVNAYILSNRIQEMNLVRWKNCKEFYRASTADVIDKMLVSDCSFDLRLWVNDHNDLHGLVIENIREMKYLSSFPKMDKFIVDKDTYAERYTLPENVKINLSATNSSTAKYVVCGNNLASDDPADYFVGIVSGSDGGTLTRTVYATSDTPTVTSDGSGNIVFTQKNNSGSYFFFPVGMFYSKEHANIKMSATIKSESAVKFIPYIAIVNCETGKLSSRFSGSSVQATPQGATIQYQHGISPNHIAMCYYYCYIAVANAVTTFEDMTVTLENIMSPCEPESIQPYEAKRLTGNGSVLSLAGVNNIMSSETNFHVSFGADYIENPI